MKRMTRFLSVLLAVLTVVTLLGSFPGVVRAAELDEPDVTISNVASTGKIRLTWEAVEGAVKYEVYRSTSENGKFSRLITTTKTSITNNKITVGKTYYYYVKAIGADGTSVSSDVVSRICKIPCPAVTVSNVASSGKIAVSWEPVEGAVKYQVYRSTSKNGTYSRLITTTKTSITNSKTNAGVSYYYKVKAIANNTNASSEFSAAKARMCDLPRPTVTLSSVASTGKIQVSWNAVEGAVKYQVYRADSEDGPYSRLITTTATSITNNKITAGKAYYYKVRAIAENSSANSAFSTVKYRTCDLARPEVTASPNSDGKPQLTWSAISGAAKYQVYRASSKSGTYSRIATVAEPGYVDSDAAAGKTYYYKVRAVHDVSAANSAYSAVVSAAAVSGTQSQSGYYYVKTNSVTLYKSASSSSSSIRIPYMAEVKSESDLTSVTGKYCKVIYKGSTYYVWLAAGNDKFTAKQSSFSYTGNTPYQQEVLDLAMTIYKEWDTDYVSGESGVKHSDGRVGFDCSGLASYVLNTVMQEHVPAWRLTANLEKLYAVKNIYNEDLPGEVNAVKVALADIQPGDILFFNTDGVLGHCGIYLGNGEFIHSTTTWDGVAISPLAGSYTERFVGARRYLPEQVQPANTTMYLTSGCKLYENRSGEGNYLTRLSKGTAVTVLYVKSDFTAYVRTADGTCGFLWAKYLSTSK